MAEQHRREVVEAISPRSWADVRGAVLDRLEEMDTYVESSGLASNAVIQSGEKILEPKSVIGGRLIRDMIQAAGVPQTEVEVLVKDALRDREVLEILGDLLAFGDNVRDDEGIKSARMADPASNSSSVDTMADTLEVPVVDE